MLNALGDYELRHLAAHLEDAGRWEDLHRLLALEADGTNTWYDLKDRAGDAGYVDDVLRASRLAGWASDAAADGEKRAHAIGLLCRYALLASSIASRFGEVPAELFPLLVEGHVWSAEQALAHAAQVPSERGRSEALAAVAPVIPQTLVPVASETAWRIGSEYWRLSALAALAPRLAPDARAELLAAACASESEEARAETLVALVPLFAKDERSAIADELRRALPAMRWGARRVAALGPSLVALGYEPEEALALVLSLPVDAGRDGALRRLAPTLPAALVRRVAREIGGDDPVWPVELGALEPSLARPDAVPAALEAVRAREVKDHRRPLALVDLALCAPTHERPAIMAEALQAIHAMGGATKARPLLGRLIPELPETLLPEALAVARERHWETSRAATLAQLATRLTGAEAVTVRGEAVAIARAVEGRTTTVRAEALIEVAVFLPEPERTSVLREALQPAANKPPPRGFVELARAGHTVEALALAQRVGDEDDAASALGALAVQLPEARQLTALEAAFDLLPDESGNGFRRSEVLAELAPHLPHASLSGALDLARALGENDVHDALVAVVVRLAKLGEHGSALAAARDIAQESDRLRALAGIAPHLPSGLRARALTDALAAAAGFALPANLPSIFPELAAQLSGDLLEEAITIARMNPVDWAKAELLAGLASHVPQVQRPTLVAEALAAAGTVSVEEFKQETLTRIAPRLAQIGYAPLALSAVRKEPWWGDEGRHRRARALAGVAPYLEGREREEVLAEALDAVRAIPSAETRALQLRELALHLRPTEREMILAEALSTMLDLEAARTRLLVSVLPVLPRTLLPEVVAAIERVTSQPERSDLVAQLISTPAGAGADANSLVRDTLHLLEGGERVAAFRGVGALAPAITEVAGPIAVAEAVLAVRQVARWFP